MSVFRIVLVALILAVPANLMAQGSFLGGCPSLSCVSGNVKVNPYAQFGFQMLGSNLNLPIQNDTPQILTLNVGDMDISLKDANFWAGIAGITILAYEKYSVFASAGGLLDRPFITSGVVPVSLGPLSASANLEFTNTKTESWFIQTGIGLGPVLLGLYWDQFAFALGDPRDKDGPIANQTLRGDILTKTFAPFVGIAIPAGGAMLAVTYSPMATSNTSLALMSSQANVSELRYTWKKPGDMVNAMFQYNTQVSSLTSLGVWCNYSWLRMCQEADLEFQYAPTPLIDRQKAVTATMTKYAVGGGLMLGVNF